jgi:phosphate uptake regulator
MTDAGPPETREDELPDLGEEARNPARLQRILIAYYIAGARGVRFPRPSEGGEHLQAILGRLPGARVLDADDEVRVGFPRSQGPDPDERLRRLHKATRRTLAIAKTGIEERPDTEIVDRLSEEERRCDRQLFALQRTANQDDARLRPGDALLRGADRLERIADYAEEITLRAAELTPQERIGAIADRIETAIGEAMDLVDRAHRALAEPDATLAHGVIDDIEDWTQDVEGDAISLAGGPRRPDQLPDDRLYRGYFSLLEDTERVGLYARSIAEAALDRSAREQTLAPAGSDEG